MKQDEPCPDSPNSMPVPYGYPSVLSVPSSGPLVIPASLSHQPINPFQYSKKLRT